MPLLYLAASLAGVGALVLFNRLLVASAPAVLDRQSACALLAQEEPGFRLAEFACGAGAALAVDGGGAVFLLAAAGERLVSRKLAPGMLSRLACDGPVLVMCLRDVTFRRARLELGSAGVAQAWQQRLLPFALPIR